MLISSQAEQPTARRPTLRSLLILSISVIVLAMVAMLAFARYQSQRAAAYDEVAAQIEAAQSRLMITLPKAVWDLDEPLEMRLISGEARVPHLLAIVVKAKDGKVQASVVRGADGKVSPAKAPERADKVVTSAIGYVDDGKQQELGTLEFHISYDATIARLHSDTASLAVALLLFGVVLLVAVTTLLAVTVLGPIDRLRRALMDVASGDADLSKRLEPGSTAEFIAISQAFNLFVERLGHTIMEVRQRCGVAAGGTAEIASSNQDLAQRTEEQAAIVQESAGAVTRLLDGVSETTSAAEKVKELASEAGRQAIRGGELMTSVIDVIGAISSSSRKITEIIGVIDGISFQTNILALNAAVEAARAGEQGRGFAVVASEVRALAARSATAAKEIKSLITSTVETVAEGQRRVEQGGAAIDSLVSSVQRVSGHIDDITHAVGSQQRQIGLIGEGIAGAERMAQMNSALVEEVSAATNTVNQSMTDLVDVLRAFRLREESASPLILS